MTASYNATSLFTLMIRANDSEVRRVILKIARRYNLEYTITSNQIYLFISNCDTLVNVANELHSEDIDIES